MPEQEFNAVFSKRLRYYLELHNVTQIELARKLGVGTTSIYNWCNGIKTPRMDKVDAMCDFFGIKRSDLMIEHANDTLENEKSMILAAHFDGDEFSKEELDEIQNYAAFVKSRRKDEGK